jgi:hypothetical protein
MRLEFKQDGKVIKAFVARTSRGFNKKQKIEIKAFREQLQKQGAVLLPAKVIVDAS